MKYPALLVLLVACGSSDDGPPVTVHLTTATTPKLVRVQDGTDAAWVAPTQISGTAYDAVVHGPYRLTVMCQVDEDPSAILMTYQLARTPEDGVDVSVLCGPRRPIVQRYHVRGQAVQAGSIQLGDQTFFVTDHSGFDLEVPAGTYDLYATSDNAIAVRHGIAITGDADLSTIDAEAEGDAYSDLPLNVTNTQGEPRDLLVNVSLSTTPTLFTSGLVSFVTPPAPIKVAPASIVGSRERQLVTVSTQGGRGVTRPFAAGDDPEFRLPDAPALTWSADWMTASWSSLDDRDQIQLESSGVIGDVSGSYQVTMTPRFRAVTGATSASVELDIPGADPSWQLELLSQSILKTSRTVDGVTVFNDATYPQRY